MSEVRKWLEAIGITQYANVFEANDLDMDLPRQVDDQKLKDIGVSSAGHRLRISNAIAKLGPEGTLGKGVNARNAVGWLAMSQKKLGDGLLALFGYPLAHENDAERAARAALSIQRALADLNRKNAGSGKPELTARIGLGSGPAVLDAAGEIYGDVAIDLAAARPLLARRSCRSTMLLRRPPARASRVTDLASRKTGAAADIEV